MRHQNRPVWVFEIKKFACAVIAMVLVFGLLANAAAEVGICHGITLEENKNILDLSGLEEVEKPRSENFAEELTRNKHLVIRVSELENSGAMVQPMNIYALEHMTVQARAGVPISYRVLLAALEHIAGSSIRHSLTFSGINLPAVLGADFLEVAPKATKTLGSLVFDGCNQLLIESVLKKFSFSGNLALVLKNTDSLSNLDVLEHLELVTPPLGMLGRKVSLKLANLPKLTSYISKRPRPIYFDRISITEVASEINTAAALYRKNLFTSQPIHILELAYPVFADLVENSILGQLVVRNLVLVDIPSVEALVALKEANPTELGDIGAKGVNLAFGPGALITINVFETTMDLVLRLGSGVESVALKGQEAPNLYEDLSKVQIWPFNRYQTATRKIAINNLVSIGSDVSKTFFINGLSEARSVTETPDLLVIPRLLYQSWQDKTIRSKISNPDQFAKLFEVHSTYNLKPNNTPEECSVCLNEITTSGFAHQDTIVLPYVAIFKCKHTICLECCMKAILQENHVKKDLRLLPEDLHNVEHGLPSGSTACIFNYTCVSCRQKLTSIHNIYLLEHSLENDNSVVVYHLSTSICDDLAKGIFSHHYSKYPTVQFIRV
ncbi:hypothetical protein NEDG_01863 [Nematocida displodere]|uniref:Uncharacterized protein n=1 Tax=Nematocida displodere TaxID=1805483 RepID=A0A177EJC6_9MICR|nr:hypothetical protein NEDG_01863 [Nematocida displodere]